MIPQMKTLKWYDFILPMLFGRKTTLTVEGVTMTGYWYEGELYVSSFKKW